MAPHFAALADAQVRLDVGAGRDFLQENLHGLGAFGAFEGEGAGSFEHGDSEGQSGDSTTAAGTIQADVLKAGAVAGLIW